MIMQFPSILICALMSGAVGLRCWHTASSVTQPRLVYNARVPTVLFMFGPQCKENPI
jgi:hypothetical protein